MAFRQLVGTALLALLATALGAAAQEEATAAEVESPTSAPTPDGINPATGATEPAPTLEPENEGTTTDAEGPTPSEVADAELDALQEGLLDRIQRDAADAARSDDTLEELRSRVDRTKPGTPDMEVLFLDIRRALRQQLDVLEAELDRLNDPYDVEMSQARSRRTARRRFGIDGPATEPLPSAGEESVGVDRALRRQEEDNRWREVQREGELAGGLLDLRSEVLRLLPDKRRDDLFSLSPAGRQEIRFEWDVALIWEHAFNERRRQLLSRSSSMWDSLRSAGYGLRVLIRIGIAVLMWLIVRRRIRALADSVDEDRPGSVWKRVSSAAGPGVLIVLAAFGIDWALQELDEWPIARQIVLLTYLYGGYRVAADSLSLLIVRVAVWNHSPLTGAEHTRITTQVRWVVRWATVVLVVANLVSLRVGPGVLRYHTVNLGWLVGLLLTVLFVVSWRHELAGRYLALLPGGVLAPRVRRWEGRAVQAFYAPALAVAMSGHAVMAMARDTAMKSARTKRLLAYFLRRRVEQQAQEHGYADVDLARLPVEVVEAFDPAIGPEDWACLGPVEMGDEEVPVLTSWKRGRNTVGVVLTGESDSCRAAWLSRLERQVPVVRLPLRERVLDRDGLHRRLSVAYSEWSGSEVSIAEAITTGPPRVLVVTDAENLFLSDVNGFHAVTAIGELVQRSHPSVAWALSMEGLAFQHLRASQPQMVALRHIALPDWSDEQIARLIHRRSERLDLSISFRDLAVTIDPMAAADEQRSALAYARLLWDYSDGNPAVALHFFLRSLVPREDGGFTVRFFRRPSTAEIARMGDDALFILAAIVRHTSLSTAEAVRVTCLSSEICAPLVMRLDRLGVIEASDLSYRVALHWRATVLRLLRRRNMLPAS